MPEWAPVALTLGIALGGALICWGVYRRMLDEFDRRLALGDARFRKMDEEAVKSAFEDGDTRARLKAVERTAQKIDGVERELVDFRAESRTQHQNFKEALEGLRASLQGVNRQLANIASKGLEYHAPEPPEDPHIETRRRATR